MSEKGKEAGIAVTAEELVKISRLVSELVLDGMSVETKEMPIAEAKKLGAIALFDLDPYNCRAGVGILIYDKRDQGQGYASQALSSLIRYGFQVLGLNQLYCDIPSHNIRSLALFKSKGFTVVGLKKEWTRTTSDWQDEYMLQLLNPQKWG